MAESQQRAMEMDMHESKVVVKKRRIIPDSATLMEKGIKILDLDRFMWT
jgi:hypothetical protein